MKKKKEEIWSANPAKCTFLMIIFFGGRPINFEVKVMSNDNNNIRTEYFFMKNNFIIDDFNNNLVVSLDKKSGAKRQNMLTYYNKKVTLPIKEMTSVANTNYGNKNTFKDPLNEIFEMKINIPKNNLNINNINANSNNKMINLNQLLLNETEQSFQENDNNQRGFINDNLNGNQTNKTPIKTIPVNEGVKNPSAIINYIDQVPKNTSNYSQYNNNQSNTSSNIPPKYPKQYSQEMNSLKNNDKISKLVKGDEYEQSLIFASSKGTSRLYSVSNSKVYEEPDSIRSKNTVN